MSYSTCTLIDLILRMVESWRKLEHTDASLITFYEVQRLTFSHNMKLYHSYEAKRTFLESGLAAIQMEQQTTLLRKSTADL